MRKQFPETRSERSFSLRSLGKKTCRSNFTFFEGVKVSLSVLLWLLLVKLRKYREVKRSRFLWFVLIVQFKAHWFPSRYNQGSVLPKTKTVDAFHLSLLSGISKLFFMMLKLQFKCMNVEMSTLPWGSRWARCSGVPSTRPCWACTCLHRFQSSCRKLLSVHPLHLPVGSAFCWEDGGKFFLKIQMFYYNKVRHSERERERERQACSYLVRVPYECDERSCSTACLLGSEEKLSGPSSIFVPVINSTGETPMVTVFLSRF